MKQLLTVLTVILLTVYVLDAQENSWKGPSVDFKHGNLKVSENKHFLVFEDGTPFFYLGDTGWELFHRLNKQETEKYLENRRSKGFTVIQAVALAELDGLNAPNAEGNKPLLNNSPLTPNEKYFEHVDWVIKRAEEKGIFIGLLPTWGDKWNKKWGEGPQIFNPENAKAYGKFIGERYKNNPNIIWILGGDRPVEVEIQRQVIVAMAEGVREGDGGKHLISFHPTGGNGSSQYFHNEQWLDFNMRQNGHSQSYTERYYMTSDDYNLEPVKPVIDGEPIYEDHPVDFNPDKNGHSTATDVRRPLYWDLFSGAFGHTYGHHSVWQMYAPEREPINRPLMPWYEAIDQPGAGQMMYGRLLMESRPFLTRIPDNSIIVTDKIASSVPGNGSYRFVATRDEAGTYAMVYVPVGRKFSVRMDAIKGREVVAWWFNPRNGEAKEIGKYSNTGTQTFIAPAPGENLDWILVLDDASKKYPAPGTKKIGIMRLGVSSYTYTWAVGVPGSMPLKPLTANGLVDKAAASGLKLVQIADNLPLEKMNEDELIDLRNYGAAKGVEIEMGGRGLTPEHTINCLEAAKSLNSPILRMVIDGTGYEPDLNLVISIIRELDPEFKSLKIKLAIENHDRFKAREFEKIIQGTGSEWVGICLDSVNSMGAGEGFEEVSRILLPYTINLHIKDFTIRRVSHKMGIIAEGAPAGKGMLNVSELVNKLNLSGSCQSAILELWTPPEKEIGDTILKEEKWADESIEYLKTVLK